MRKFLKILFPIVIATLIFASCGSDDPSCDDEAEVNRILDSGTDSIIDAVTAYSTDQSESNCNALKNAYNDWIDDLESLQSCADEVGQGQEFRIAINNSRDSLNDIPC